MFIAFRLLKLGVKIALLLAPAFVAFVAWGNFWPTPSHAPRIKCPRHHYQPCRTISGRVLYHTAFGPMRKAHVVLMSRSSITLPGISSIELPRVSRTPGGLSTGDWISVLGSVATGSHGEKDFHARGFATATVAMRCGGQLVRFSCHRVQLGGHHAALSSSDH